MHAIRPLLLLLALAPLACSAPGSETVTPAPTPAPMPTPVVQAASPIPAGFFAITPQLTVQGVDQAVEFYVAALGASKVLAMTGPDGKTLHAELKIGDSMVFIDEEMDDNKSPRTLGGTPGSLMLYVMDADATYAAAVAAGAKPEQPLEDQFWGDRYGTVIDPFGHRWAIATQIEALTTAQTEQRAAIMFGADGGKKGKKPTRPGKRAPVEPAWKKVAGTPATSPIPEDYHSVTMALTVNDAAALIDFYKAAFAATEIERMPAADGKVLHAGLRFGDSRVILGDEFPGTGVKSAKTLGGSPMVLHLYSTDTDATFARATAAGAKITMPVADMFWGDRYGAVTDPAGFTWGLATHKEDLSPAQMNERMQAQMRATPSE